MSTNDNLDSMTDAALSKCFDFEVAERLSFTGEPSEPFATSADAVLSHLNAAEYGWSCGNDGIGSGISHWCNVTTRNGTFKGWDSSFARAACKALLRSKRSEKGQP